ncbi:hypothetical protein VTK73DRAFT_1477 [Phialemonium thermophilum]|uniref:Uncharacterized protein n=1 Tax=Phialemonium thermophilum TaxID=223376 RepID=A0ABR3VTE3_9PEZI
MIDPFSPVSSAFEPSNGPPISAGEHLSYEIILFSRPSFPILPIPRSVRAPRCLSVPLSLGSLAVPCRHRPTCRCGVHPCPKSDNKLPSETRRLESARASHGSAPRFLRLPRPRRRGRHRPGPQHRHGGRGAADLHAEMDRPPDGGRRLFRHRGSGTASRAREDENEVRTETDADRRNSSWPTAAALPSCVVRTSKRLPSFLGGRAADHPDPANTRSLQ